MKYLFFISLLQRQTHLVIPMPDSLCFSLSFTSSLHLSNVISSFRNVFASPLSHPPFFKAVSPIPLAPLPPPGSTKFLGLPGQGLRDSPRKKKLKKLLIFLFFLVFLCFFLMPWTSNMPMWSIPHIFCIWGLFYLHSPYRASNSTQSTLIHCGTTCTGSHGLFVIRRRYADLILLGGPRKQTATSPE